MKIVIIEDEIKAAKSLANLISQIRPEASIVASLQSIESSVNFLTQNAAPDLIFMDVQLSDGLSFEIFKSVKINCPVVFCTAYGEYAMDAIKTNGIDYILKPFSKEQLEQAFEKVDCLECAACCKNYSPRFKTPDIKRISKHLRMRESEFIDKYLNLDTDGDYVVKSSPCAFLGADNYCSIYEVRPSDCSRFPYTDEDVLLKRQQITLKNASFCPAVYFVLEKLIQSK